ncbi:hypothetical protein ABE67_06680 [Cytobacillus firmus]|jgi:hypothetical protein|nr:hypothetical protein [Cytobacillus firmus]
MYHLYTKISLLTGFYPATIFYFYYTNVTIIIGICTRKWVYMPLKEKLLQDYSIPKQKAANAAF